jgi:hypothetical protein
MEGKDKHKAEAILDSNYVNSIMLYYVKWGGHYDEDYSWEPVEHLTSSADLIS